MTDSDKRAIVSLAYRPEWAAYEKLLNNLIFRNYRQILIDEDIKAARKLIFFATALKNTPKSLKNENNMDSERNQIDSNEAGEDFGIEI